MKNIFLLVVIGGAVLLGGALVQFVNFSTSHESPPSRFAKATPAPPTIVVPEAAAATLVGRGSPPLTSAPSAHAHTAASKRPELFPFRYLGRVGEGQSSAVVLFGNGQVLQVVAPGPLDENYAVDEVGDQYLVLRNVRLNMTKRLEFESPRKTALASAPTLKDYPQD